MIIKNNETEWFVTDPDCAQCCRLEKDNENIFHFIQINEIGEDAFRVVTGYIDLRDYTEDELKTILDSYDYSLSEEKQYIAEAVFETECMEYDYTSFPTWNQAVSYIENYTKQDLSELKENPLNIVRFEESEYLKEYRPYFDTRAKYGRDADTLLLFQLKTPTGKWSKKWATLRFNSEHNVKNKVEQIEAYKERLENEVYKQEIKKGYSIGEIILYSGAIEELGLESLLGSGLKKSSANTDIEKNKDETVSLTIHDYVYDDFTPAKVTEFTINKDTLEKYLDEFEYEGTTEDFLNNYNSDDAVEIYFEVYNTDKLIDEKSHILMPFRQIV